VGKSKKDFQRDTIKSSFPTKKRQGEIKNLTRYSDFYTAEEGEDDFSESADSPLLDDTEELNSFKQSN